MKLSTGRVAFPIEFDNGDKDCIYFNPNDPELATRLIASKDKISERIEKLDTDGVELSASGEPVAIDKINDVSEMTEEQIEQLAASASKISDMISETKKIICEELDTAFRGDISSAVFKHCSPFAVVDGNYFIMNFLEAITPEIKKHIDNASSKVNEKMKKYTEKYNK